jgi:hypothetical protein
MLLLPVQPREKWLIYDQNSHAWITMDMKHKKTYIPRIKMLMDRLENVQRKEIKVIRWP